MSGKRNKKGGRKKDIRDRKIWSKKKKKQRFRRRVSLYLIGDKPLTPKINRYKSRPRVDPELLKKADNIDFNRE